MEENLPSGYRYGSGYIGLPYEISQPDPTIVMDGETMVVKPEFHMSIFCVKKYAPMLAEKEGIALEEGEQKILEIAGSELEKHPISIERFTDEFRVAEERDKKTVVVMVEATNLKTFFDAMRQRLGMDFPDQPTHITLYTRQPGVGIGLPDPAEVEKLTRRLTPSESEIVKTAIHIEK